MKKFKIKKRYISFVISAFLIYLIVNKLDFDKILQTLSSCDIKILLLAVPVYFLGYLARAARWKCLMMNKDIFRIPTLMGITFIGYMVNCFMPARAGDFYRAHLTGQKFGTSRMTVFSSILLERIFDGIVVLSMLLAAMVFFFHQAWLYKLALSVGLVFGGSFIFVYCLFKYSDTEVLGKKFVGFCKKYPNLFKDKFLESIENINKHLKSFIGGFEVLNSPECLAYSFVATALIWVIETFFVFIIINSFHGISLGLPAALLVMCLGVFSAMVPSVSVHAGPYQCAFILALGAYGITKETAVAMAITTQIVMISFIVTSGVYYLFRYHIKLKNLQEIEAELDKEEKEED